MIYQSQLFDLESSWIQNTYFLIENSLPQAFQIKFDASTPSESAVAPKLNFIEFGLAQE